LQFDLIRKHSERLHERVAQMEKREEEGGALSGLRNLMDASRTIAEFGDLIGGSYIRASRTLGYNPAEMEWVRERIAETSTYLLFKPVQEGFAAGAREARERIEALQAEAATG